MQLQSEVQSDSNKYRDLVTASMETGNHGRARTLLAELKDVDETLYHDLRSDIIAEYGVAL